MIICIKTNWRQGIVTFIYYLDLMIIHSILNTMIE